MEHAVKSVIFDYYGLPGAGKTTLSHQKAEEYRQKGLSVAEPSYGYDHSHGKLARKLAKVLHTFSYALRHPRRVRAVRRLVTDNGYAALGEQAKQTINIVIKLDAVERCTGKFSYILFDEGPAQAAVSLSVNSAVPASENLAKILALLPTCPDYQTVLVSAEPKEALRRVEARASGDTRIERLPTREERLALMEKYKEACDSITPADHA